MSEVNGGRSLSATWGSVTLNQFSWNLAWLIAFTIGPHKLNTVVAARGVGWGDGWSCTAGQSWTWVTFSWRNPIQSNPQRSFHADPHPIQSIHDKIVVTLHFWQFYALNKCNISVISIAHDMLLKLKIQFYCPGVRPQERSTLSIQIH